MKPIKTYVISLLDEKKRREVVTARLKAINHEFVFFDAIDGRSRNLKNDLSYSGVKRRLFFGKDLTSPELGVMFSNKEILKDIIKNNYREALVFEDDVIIKDNFHFILSKLYASDISWELIRFLGKPKMAKYRQRKIFNLDGPFNLVRIGSSPGGSYAYIISQEGAKKLLKSMDKVYLPPDILMGSPWITNIEVMVVMPTIASWDNDFPSAIDSPNRYTKKKDLKGVEVFIYPISRLIFKIKIALQKRIYFYRYYFRDKKTFARSL
ncbi:MAG: glycosyltransferase family 25 protein [Methylophilaceae bacterium]|nr:glycosyltransferase family 25 protein [Methylophilaceae bacterium]